MYLDVTQLFSLFFHTHKALLHFHMALVFLKAFSLPYKWPTIKIKDTWCIISSVYFLLWLFLSKLGRKYHNIGYIFGGKSGCLVIHGAFCLAVSDQHYQCESYLAWSNKQGQPKPRVSVQTQITRWKDVMERHVHQNRHNVSKCNMINRL